MYSVLCAVENVLFCRACFHKLYQYLRDSLDCMDCCTDTNVLTLRTYLLQLVQVR